MLNTVDLMCNNIIPQGGFSKHYYTLYSIVEGLEAQTTFEFGMGLSTEVILNAQLKIKNPNHTTCDIRKLSDINVSVPNYLLKNWTFIHGDSREIDIPPGPYDFVLHDGSHAPEILLSDIGRIIRKMKKNSILMIHDTMNQKYRLSLSISAAIRDIRCESITLPYGYGLTIIRVLEDFGNGVVSPKWKKI